MGLKEAVKAIKRQRPDGDRPVPRRLLHREGLAGRQPARDRGGARARRADAWSWWSAGCRGDRRICSAPGETGPGLHRRDPARGAQGGRAARDRAAAPDAGGRARLRQHARAGARHLRRAGRGHRRRGATSTTSGGTRSSSSRSQRAGRSASSRYHICDWLAPTRDLLQRPRHDGRRRHRPAAQSLLGRRRRLSGLPGSRDLLRARLVEARPGRGARDLQATRA